MTILPLAIHLFAAFKTVEDAMPLPDENDPYQSIGFVKPIEAATRITLASISPYGGRKYGFVLCPNLDTQNDSHRFSSSLIFASESFVRFR